MSYIFSMKIKKYVISLHISCIILRVGDELVEMVDRSGSFFFPFPFLISDECVLENSNKVCNLLHCQCPVNRVK